MGTKLLMIGIDGGDRTLIDQLVRDGRMPALAALRTRGVSGRLAPLPGLGDDAAWHTFSTGVGPGIHGRFNHQQVIPGTYVTSNFDRSSTRHAPFWKAFAEAGLHVGVVDVPKSPLAGIEHGIEVADWMPYGEDSSLVTINPANHAYSHAIERDPDFDCDSILLETRETVAHAETVRARGKQRRKVLHHLLASEEWDFFLAALAEPHCAGHHFWNYHDPTHLQYNPADVARFGDLVAAEYEAADSTIGSLVAAAGEDATVVVFAPVGMGANYSAAHFLDEILRRIEGSPSPRRTDLAWVNRLLPSWMKVLARRRYADAVSSLTNPKAGQKAFVVPHDAISSAIRLNVQGREPSGSIEPGADFDKWCHRLSDALLALEDSATGRPVFREVVRTADAYPGPHAAAFADLLVVWETTAPVVSIKSDELGVFEGWQVDRAGNHRPGGWFTMAGPGDCSLCATDRCRARRSSAHRVGVARAGIRRRRWAGHRSEFAGLEDLPHESANPPLRAIRANSAIDC